jgi:hypothetical protein
MDRDDIMYYYQEDDRDYDHWGHFIDLDMNIDLHIQIQKPAYKVPERYSRKTYLFKHKLDKVLEEDESSVSDADGSKKTNNSEHKHKYKNELLIRTVIVCAIGVFAFTYYMK